MNAARGVWPIRAALEEEFGKDTPELHTTMQNHSVILYMAWNKVIK